MKIRALIFFICIFCASEGCKKDNPISPPNKPPIADDTTTVYFQINFLGMHPLRDSEFYVLWVKEGSDSSWRMISVLNMSYITPTDTAIFVGKFLMPDPLDSIKDALVSLERTLTPSLFWLPIARCGMLSIDSSKKHLSSLLDATQFLGDYTQAQGSLVFTSTLADSLSYNHEFYLMNQLGAKQSPSLLSLNLPPKGWKFGLWAEDLNFTPHEYFFYGLFSTPQGHDSDSTNDHYPYPGGWKPQQINMPGGSIVVTLEPVLYGDNLKFKGPSSFTLLQFNRIRFISKDKNYPMANVSLGNVPSSGRITFRRN